MAKTMQEWQAKDYFMKHLKSVYGDIEIAKHRFTVADILYKMDPGAFRTDMLEQLAFEGIEVVHDIAY